MTTTRSPAPRAPRSADPAAGVASVPGRLPGRTSRRAAALALAGAAALALAGCSALPDRPTRPTLYDFGPGPAAPQTADRQAPQPPLATIAIGTVEPVGVSDTTAVLYRFGYANAQQLRPYALARWSMAPSQLVRQRLREVLGQRRAVLDADDVASLQRVDGRAPRILRLQLEEFSQLFTAPGASLGTLRLRATLLENTAGGERLIGQRVLAVQRPAPTADAPGGVQALSAATDAAAQELAAWLEQAAP
ncbi:MAG: ABC-type transport auxiliary lipoprotein family protein [Xylophilus ampelinus]